MSPADILEEAGSDPAIVAALIQSSETSVSELKHTMQTKVGLDVFDCILEDMQQRKRSSDSKNLSVIMAAFHASAWINDKMDEWLGEKTLQTPFPCLYLITLLRKWVWSCWMLPM